MNKLVMSVSVCTVLLAASAAVTGSLSAAEKTTAQSTATKAYAALVDGRVETAIKNYTIAIESRELPHVDLARALLNRGLAYQNTGKYIHAVGDYSAAMQLDELSPKMRSVALYNRGLANQKLEAPAMAIEDFTSALLLNPKFARAYYSRANVLREHGQYLFAIADYKKARMYNHPKPHLTYFGEALTFEALNQKTRARLLLLKVAQMNPKFTAAKLKLEDLNRGKQAAVLKPAKNNPIVSVAMVPPTQKADTLITSSILPTQSDITITKNELPEAVGVPGNLNTTALAPKMPPLPKVTKLASLQPVTSTVSTHKTPIQKVSEKPAEPKKNKTAVKSGNTPVTAQAIGWSVQLTSQRASDAAWDVWKNLSAKHRRLLTNKSATVVKANLGSRGTYYRLRVHKLKNKASARSLCTKLKRKGVSCYVTKA